MLLKQLSIFVENRIGAFTDATAVLFENNINIRAFSSADTTDFGIIRLIVDQPELAAQKLRDASLIVNIADVIGVKLPDVPGSFHNVLKILSDAGLTVEYSYAFVSRNIGDAYIILRVQEEERAIKVLSDNCISFLNGTD